MSEYIKLPDDKVELLYQANKLSNHEVVDSDALEQLKRQEAERRGLVVSDPTSLPLDDLVDASQDPDAPALRQRPETGGLSPDDRADADTTAVLDRLSAREVNEAQEETSKYRLFMSRDMQQRAEDYADEVCEILGVDSVEDVPEDELDALGQ